VGRHEGTVGCGKRKIFGTGEGGKMITWEKRQELGANDYWRETKRNREDLSEGTRGGRIGKMDPRKKGSRR